MNELDLEKIFAKPVDLDNVTDEELLYWATPYYDVIQEQKKMKQERLKEEVRDNG